MANDWEVSKATGHCAVTGRKLEEGEVYYAALFERPEGLVRQDVSADAWTGPPPESFCYWKARVPVREKRSERVSVDQALLMNLFLRLEDEASEAKQRFRFVLALLLMRKRLLKFEQTVRDGETEYWQMRLVEDQSVHQVLNPRLTDEQTERLGRQLTAILSGEVDAIETLEQAEPDAPPTEPTEHAGGGPDEASCAPQMSTAEGGHDAEQH